LDDDGVDLHDGPRGVDDLRLGLGWLVDEEGGAWIEYSARGYFVLLGPGG
jgi:hypothetical protein